MTLFFIFAALMVGGALITMLPGMLRTPDATFTDQLQANVEIARERRETIDQALANGSIDQETFDLERDDLERSLADDMGKIGDAQHSNRGGVVVASIIGLLVPIAAGALYLHLGTPAAIDTAAYNQNFQTTQTANAVTAAGQNAPALAELLPALEQKLAENPDDRDGWKLLGRTYLTISDFANAKRALTRAFDIDRNDPDLLAQLAEATAMERGGDLSGEPFNYLQDALTIDSSHEQSRWLMAIATQQAGEHTAAIVQFEALKAGVSGNQSALASIEQMINRSRSALGQQVPDSDKPAGNTQNQPEQSATAAASTAKGKAGVSLSVTVSLNDAARAAVGDDLSVFIYATATTGPPMPLAVSRHTVAQLPVTITLDDSMAMIPAMKLSGFESVTVGARVSQSGNPIAQTGDWYTETTNVSIADAPELTLVIDRQK